MDFQKLSIKEHLKKRGKISLESKFPIANKKDLSIAYTPGVAGPCLEIAKNKKLAYKMTSMKNAVAVISDGSAVLGLGDIGPEAALPVMEGKCALFKKFAGLDAVPIVLNTKNTEEIIAAVKAIAPTFGGINLEDISAPRCFEIEERLKNELEIPVMHDDQHGTAIVTLAGLINAVKLAGKKWGNLAIVVSGVGAAGVAIIKLIKKFSPKTKIIALDSVGIIHKKRSDINSVKKELIEKKLIFTEKEGDLKEALKNADIFIGVSKAGLLNKEMIENMKSKPIIFAMANPNPEIKPDEAKSAGAFVVATGRSDFPNQINNVLAYPGIFKGAIEKRISKISDETKIEAAKALALLVKKPSKEKIIPDVFDKKVVEAVSKSVKTSRKKN